MQNKCKKFRLWSILLLVMLMAAGFTCHSTSRDVQAATKNGFRTVKGKTYYYKNGKKVKGWLTLNGKKYTVDFITGRALREMEPAAKMYSRIVALSNAALKGETPEEAKELSIGEAMDVMIRWFCILFGNQFTPDDVLDHYPVDRLMHDIALALMAVQTQTTEILDEFPTKAAKTEPPTATA